MGRRLEGGEMIGSLVWSSRSGGLAIGAKVDILEGNDTFSVYYGSES